jgi:hypothetical protein
LSRNRPVLPAFSEISPRVLTQLPAKIFFVLSIATLTQGCTARAGSPAEHASVCDDRVMLAFTDNSLRPTDEDFVRDLSIAAGVKLAYVSQISTSLSLFNLSAAGADAQCRAALARLRADTRIKSADLDTRRTHH